MIKDNPNFKKNLVFAFSAQFVSLLLSVLMSIVVPKFLNVENFGFWQLFLFYVSYAGFFHFGLTDGIYLTIGGKKVEELDKKELNNQFHILFYIQCCISIIVLITSKLYFSNEKTYILNISAFYILIANLNWFLGYIFQAINETKIYSISVMIDRVLFIIFVCLTFIFKINSFYFLMILYTFTRMVALLYCVKKSNNILSIKTDNVLFSLKNTFNFIKIGINVTLSSIASMLIIGVGRFFVENKWGIEEFSKFSFAISLTNFFLTFIQQISMVLFPALRLLKNPEDVKQFYYTCRRILCVILPLIFICYIPCKVILSWWLPQYSVSLEYLALLLPLCIFDGKMQLLSNTYMKVLREEKMLLKLNVIALIISFILSIVGTYILSNTYFIIIGLLISIIIRSILAELFLAKKLRLDVKNEIKYIFMELLFSIIFVISNFYLKSVFALLLNILYYLVYSIVLKDCIKITKEYISSKIR